MLRSPGNHQVDVSGSVAERDKDQFITDQDLRSLRQDCNPLTGFDQGDDALIRPSRWRRSEEKSPPLRRG